MRGGGSIEPTGALNISAIYDARHLLPEDPACGQHIHRAEQPWEARRVTMPPVLIMCSPPRARARIAAGGLSSADSCESDLFGAGTDGAGIA